MTAKRIQTRGRRARASVNQGQPPTEARKIGSSLELIKISYGEVLDATKHQDDKVGRFLTAIAFLTTGGIALLFGSSSVLGTQFRMAHRDRWVNLHDWYPLLAWSAFAFFICILGSVAILILTLSVPLRLPGSPRMGPSLKDSRLFFSYIGTESRAGWRARWNTDPAQIEREIYDQYVRETHNLAERANAKYSHTNEAAALFVLSLLFLGCSVVLALSTMVMQASTAPHAGATIVDLDQWTAAGIAVVASLHASAQLYARYIQDRDLLDALELDGAVAAGRISKSELRRGRWAWILFVCLVTFIFAVAVPDSPTQRCWAFVLILGSVIPASWISRPLLVSPAADDQDPPRPVRGKPTHYLIYAVAPATLAAVALAWGTLAQLTVALLPSIWLAGLALHDSHRRRRERHTLAMSKRD